jgi:Tfp pilus assembly protein PilX
MSRIAGEERGWVMVVAMATLALMIVIGLAILSVADTQSQQSRKQRERDSAFNMAEAALGNQVYVLSRNWPGSSANAFNTACNEGTTGASNQCPVDAQLRANFAQADPIAGTTTQVDYTLAPNWSTAIYDDATCSSVDYSKYYVETLTSCVGVNHYDANGNNQVWVRASATVRGHQRVLVGRAEVQKITLPFPRFVVQSNNLHIKNGGVATGTGGDIELRCTGGYIAACADYPAASVSPGSTTFGYTGTSALSASLQAALKATSKAEGHYCKIPTSATDANSVSTGFTCDASGCPSTLGNTTGSGNGWIVWADGPTAQCKYTGNTQYNSAAHPGAAIIGQGPGWFEIQGSADFYGVFYAINRLNLASPALLQWHGNGAVHGAVAADGNGSIDMCCSSKANFTFDANALGGLQVNGAAGIVQNTWRQIQ